MKQVKTTTIKGNVDYAKVADRLLEFRSQNPRSKISIKYSYDEAGNLTHTARIWKDKTECYELLKAGVNAAAKRRILNVTIGVALFIMLRLALLETMTSSEISTSPDILAPSVTLALPAIKALPVAHAKPETLASSFTQQSPS